MEAYFSIKFTQPWLSETLLNITLLYPWYSCETWGSHGGEHDEVDLGYDPV
jgi:hypothetical protein